MNDFYVPLRQEFLDARFMRACLSKYLYDSGYYCCDVFFAQVRFKSDKQPKSFQNDLGFNLVYEMLAYKPKDGWDWKRLAEEWFPSINLAKLPEQRDIDIRTFVNLAPYETGDRYDRRAKYLKRKLDENLLWEDELAQKFDIIKVYFDILSGQFFFRPFEIKSFQPYFRGDRFDWGGDFVEGYRDKPNEKRAFCKWLSRYYQDDWYEYCLYDPDYIKVGFNCVYKIGREPYYELLHKVEDKRQWSKNEHLLVEDVPVSALLSPLEIVQTLYWIHTSKWHRSYHRFMDVFDINELVSWGYSDTSWLWNERFINPNNDVYANRAFFYTGNVLELTTELKVDIANLRQDIYKLASATERGFSMLTGMMHDISRQMYRMSCCQIQAKWDHFSAFARAHWPNEGQNYFQTGLILNVFPYDEMPVDFMRTYETNLLRRSEARMEQMFAHLEGDGSASAEIKRLTQDFKQKYQDYVNALNQLSALKKKLDTEHVLSLDDVINLQKLAE